MREGGCHCLIDFCLITSQFNNNWISVSQKRTKQAKFWKIMRHETIPPTSCCFSDNSFVITYFSVKVYVYVSFGWNQYQLSPETMEINHKSFQILSVLIAILLCCSDVSKYVGCPFVWSLKDCVRVRSPKDKCVQVHSILEKIMFESV